MATTIRPTLYVGLGEFGVNLVSRWLHYLSQQLPGALPFVESLGFFYPGAEVDQALAPRLKFAAGRRKPVLSFEHWAYGIQNMGRKWPTEPPEENADQDEASSVVLPLDQKALISLIKSKYRDLGARKAPPEGWGFQVGPHSAPRVVLAGQLHDPLVKQRMTLANLSAADARGEEPELETQETRADKRETGGDLLSMLWQDVVLAEGLAVTQRDIWLILFIDPPPIAGRTGTTKDLLRQFEATCRGLLGDCRFGLHPVLISSHSRRSGDPREPATVLWSGAKENWDQDYKEKAREYGQMLLQTLLASDGNISQDGNLPTEIADYRDPQTQKLFYTVSLDKIDSTASWVRRYAVAKRLNEEIGSLLQSADRNAQEAGQERAATARGAQELAAIEDNPKGWIACQSDIDVVGVAGLTTDSVGLDDESGSQLEVEDTGSALRALEELRRQCREFLYSTEDQLKRLAAVLGDDAAAKTKIDSALRRKCLSDQEGSISRCLDEALAAARTTGGIAKCCEILRLLVSELRKEESRVRSTFKWPPDLPPNVDHMKDIEERIRNLSASNLVNRRALIFHGLVAGAVLALGSTMFASGFFAPGLYRILAMWLAGVVGVLLPLLVVLLFCLRWRRQAIELAKQLKEKHSDIRREISRRARELVEQFKNTYGRLYRLRALRQLRRLINRQRARYNLINETLRRKLESTAGEAEELSRRSPTESPWLTVFFDRSTYRANCTKAHDQLTSILASRGGEVRMIVDSPKTGDTVWQAPVDLQIAECEQELVGGAGDIEATLDDSWTKWMRTQLRGVRNKAELPALPLRHKLAGIDTSEAAPLPGSGTSRFVLCSNNTRNKFSGELASRGPHDILKCFPYLEAQDETVIVGRFIWRVSLDDIDFGGL